MIPKNQDDERIVGYSLYEYSLSNTLLRYILDLVDSSIETRTKFMACG